MNSKTTFHFGLLTLNLRRELRRALLAAMETCWVYAVIVLLTASMEKPQPLTPLPFFAAYWLALIVGRALPASRRRWVILQIASIAIAVVAVLVVARAELYPRLDWYDLTWLPRLVPALLSSPRGLAIEHIVSLGVVYVFVRGLGLAQRPLTLWFIGLQFRIGIVIFFFFLLAVGSLQTFDLYHNAYDPSSWIFVYFFLSLLAIALARIEETETEIRYGPRWAVTLLAAVALTLFIGLGVLQVLTLDTAGALMILLTPLWWLFAAAVMLLAIPAGMLAEWLVNLLQPLFANVGRILDDLSKIVPYNQQDAQQLQDSVAALTFLEPLLKTLLVLIVAFILGSLIARALNRRMKKIEDETYAREAIGADGDAAKRARGAAKGQVRSRPRALTADSIRRIYAALVARAAAAGLPRRAAETPYEFLPRLQQQWQDQASDLRAITEAYVEAHYAERDAAPEQVNFVRAAWRRIERIVKRKA
jgi:hypothetical protein